MDVSELFARRSHTWAKELAEKGWYHSLELPDGSVIEGLITLERLKYRLSKMPIAADLAGKRVLDIGAWDGWFSFEMEKRGARVTALDCVEIDNFLTAHRMMNSRVEYRQLDVLELSPARLGYHDVVLFLGVLYHLKHPLLALERVCELTRDLAIVESFVVVDQPHPIPTMEFYETGELAGQLDNWWGPTPECVAAMCRTAGFARVELVDLSDGRACFACWRNWPETPAAGAAPQLLSAAHYRDFGINFRTDLDDYVSVSFLCGAEDLRREDVFPEAGGLGSPTFHLSRADKAWVATFKLPPGIGAGWQPVRVRVRDSAWSAPQRIAVDLPLETPGVEIVGVCDGIDWTPGVTRGFFSVWVKGLPEHADRANLRIYVGATRQTVEYIDALDENGFRQVNARLRPGAHPGGHTLIVRFGDAVSNELTVRVAV